MSILELTNTFSLTVPQYKAVDSGWYISAAKHEMTIVILLENFHADTNFSGNFILKVSFLKKKKKKKRDKICYVENFTSITFFIRARS